MEKDKEAIPDEVLVVAAILGDLDAFNELVIRYRQAVLRLAKSIVGAGSAEDVAQEAWLLAFKSLPSIDNPQKFGAWLMVITRNRALRIRKKEHTRREKHQPMDVFLLEQFRSLHDKERERKEEGESVRIALDHIPDDYSMVLRMHFFDGISLKRIASFLDLPLSTVKWRIYQGKALLLDQVKKLQDAEEAWRNR